MAETPTIRWGIVGTGMISSWFVEDIILERSDAPVKHIIQAIGSSALQKGKDFVTKNCPNEAPRIYDSYEQVYQDKDVDVVYLGTPHAFHHKNCLDAITAGKNVLCEKPFTINARQAKEVLAAAKENNVYIHEAMWLRHRPLVLELRKLLHEERVIGDVFRTYADFTMGIDIASLPATSRYKDLKLGAGSLLDIGIYSLTWGILTLDPNPPSSSEMPKVSAYQSFQDGIEVTTSILLHYPSTGRQGIITSSNMSNNDQEVIARIQGTNGYIEVAGLFASSPVSFTVFPKPHGIPECFTQPKSEGKKYEFSVPGKGFVYEADNTALDILAGRKESAIMPWSETVQVMEIMDEVRRQGGTRYPADD